MIATVSGNTVGNANGGVFSIPLRKYCVEVENIINVAKSKGYLLPTDYQLRCLNFLINELKLTGIFQTYDIAYVYGYDSLEKYANKEATGNVLFSSTGELKRSLFEPFTLLNIVNPARFEASIVRSPTRNNYPWMNELGWSMGRSGIDFGGIDTGWIAKDHAVKWTQNNAGGFIYTHPYLESTNNSSFGVQDTTVNRTTISLLTNSSTNSVVGRINGVNTNRTYVAAGGVSNGSGHHRLERTGASASQYYRDGIQLGSSTGASATMDGTYSVWMGGFSSNGLRQSCNVAPISFGGLGAALGVSMVKLEYDIFTEFRNRLNLWHV
jgi:hypothetical protein